MVFQVSISSTDLATFDTFSMVLGSTTPELQMTFEYSPTLGNTLPYPAPFPVGFFPMDLAVGANRLVPPTDPTAWRAPLFVGTLTIQTTGLDLGEHVVFVDAQWEESIVGSPLSVVGTGFEWESLQGSARISVPEPATLGLLGVAVAVLGGAKVTRRRWGFRITSN